MKIGQELHITRIPVRWDELDSNRHVNNKYFQAYLDEARMQAMRAWGYSMESLREKELGPAILNITLEFRKELPYPETVSIESRMEMRSKLRAVFIQKMLRESDGGTVCTATTEWTLIDLVRRRPVPFPD